MHIGTALGYASNRCKADRTIVKEAVKKQGEALKYASEELKHNIDFCKEAVIANPAVISFIEIDLHLELNEILMKLQFAETKNTHTKHFNTYANPFNNKMRDFSGRFFDVEIKSQEDNSDPLEPKQR